MLSSRATILAFKEVIVGIEATVSGSIRLFATR